MFSGVRAAGLRTNAENTVGALDAEYQQAVKKNDVATMERILADDFVLITGNGTPSGWRYVFGQASRPLEATT